ncbi:endonuclease/exonuclease/phosphatase family protein, partial [Mesorhizobium sp. M0643]|uniref:endonuclease/exonuclease/phosphatase family protein n=1 Tax=Mesorhizobium sp. M0643 TaxID=2956978 RepID=UPI0033355A61
CAANYARKDDLKSAASLPGHAPARRPSPEAYLKEGITSVLCGDYNVVPTPLDAVVPRRWTGDAVYFPESRQAYAEMLDNGWMDAVRTIHPEKGIYTYWNFSYRGGYDRSSGLRMDHLLVSPSLSNRLRDAGVDADLRSWEKPSDHVPAWIELDLSATS